MLHLKINNLKLVTNLFRALAGNFNFGALKPPALEKIGLNLIFISQYIIKFKLTTRASVALTRSAAEKTLGTSLIPWLSLRQRNVSLSRF